MDHNARLNTRATRLPSTCNLATLAAISKVQAAWRRALWRAKCRAEVQRKAQQQWTTIKAAESAVLIQNAWRVHVQKKLLHGKSAENQLRQKRAIKEDAVVDIQRSFRGFRGRQKARQLQQERDERWQAEQVQWEGQGQDMSPREDLSPDEELPHLGHKSSLSILKGTVQPPDVPTLGGPGGTDDVLVPFVRGSTPALLSARQQSLSCLKPPEQPKQRPDVGAVVSPMAPCGAPPKDGPAYEKEFAVDIQRFWRGWAARAKVRALRTQRQRAEAPCSQTSSALDIQRYWRGRVARVRVTRLRAQRDQVWRAEQEQWKKMAAEDRKHESSDDITPEAVDRPQSSLSVVAGADFEFATAEGRGVERSKGHLLRASTVGDFAGDADSPGLSGLSGWQDIEPGDTLGPWGSAHTAPLIVDAGDVSQHQHDIAFLRASQEHTELQRQLAQCIVDRDAERLLEVLQTQHVPIDSTVLMGNVPLLHYALLQGAMECFVGLLDCRADVDTVDASMGKTPLHIAAEADCSEAVDLLLNRRADLEALDGAYRSALHWAVRHASPPLVHSMIHYGAYTVHQIHHAARLGRHEIVKVLLDCGVHADERYFCRRTALHYAADANQLGVAEVLVPARAGVNVRDDNGGTPLHYASAQGHSALVQFLLRNGAVAQVISVPMAQPKGAPQVSKQLLLSQRTEHGRLILQFLEEGPRTRNKALSPDSGLPYDTALELIAKEANHMGLSSSAGIAVMYSVFQEQTTAVSGFTAQQLLQLLNEKHLRPRRNCMLCGQQTGGLSPLPCRHVLCNCCRPIHNGRIRWHSLPGPSGSAPALRKGLCPCLTSYFKARLAAVAAAEDSDE